MSSSRGHVMVKFDSRADSNIAGDLSPIIYDGTKLMIEHSEESSNHFVLDQSWLEAISLVDFSSKH